MASVVLTAALGAGLAVAGGAVAGLAPALIVASAVTTFAVRLTTGLISRARYSDSGNYNSEISGTQLTVNSPIAPVKMVYGKCVSAGVLAYTGISGNNNEFLHMVLVIAGHEVDTIDTVFFDDKAEFHETIAPYVTIYKYTGSDNQVASTELIEVFGEWTANHRLRGLAYIHVVVERNSSIFKSIPNVKAIVKGKKVIDPRIAEFRNKTLLSIDGTTNIAIEVPADTAELERSYENAEVWGLDPQGGIFVIGGDIATSHCFWYDSATSTINLKGIVGGVSTTYSAGVEALSGAIDFFSFTHDIASGVLQLVHNDTAEAILTLPNNALFGIFTALKQDNACSASIASLEIALVGDSPFYRSKNSLYVEIVKFRDQPIGGKIPNYGVTDDLTFTGKAVFIYPEVTPEKYHRVWSKNSSLNVLDYLLDTRYGFGISLDDINLPSFTSAADISGNVNMDEYNPCPSAVYTIDGTVDTSQKIGDNLTRMLSTCMGTVIWKDGLFSLVIGENKASTFTITSDMIIGPVTHRCVNSKSEIFNSTKAVYVSGFNNWIPAETQLYRDEGAITQDGVEILQELDLPYTDSAFTAQRLAILNLRQARLEGGISILCNEEIYGVGVGDVGTVNNPESGINSEVFEVADWELIPSTATNAGGFRLELAQYDGTIYNISNEEILPPEEAPEEGVVDNFNAVYPFSASTGENV